MSEANITKLDEQQYTETLEKISDKNDKIKDSYQKIKLKAKNSEMSFATHYITTLTKLRELLGKYQSALEQTEESIDTIRQNFLNLDEQIANAVNG